jgi:hypothetical protein
MRPRTRPLCRAALSMKMITLRSNQPLSRGAQGAGWWWYVALGARAVAWGPEEGAAAGSRWKCAFALAVLWVLCCVAGSVVIRARPTSIPEQRNREPLDRRAEILAGMPCLEACGLRNQPLDTSGLGVPGTPAGAPHRIIALDSHSSTRHRTPPKSADPIERKQRLAAMRDTECIQHKQGTRAPSRPVRDERFTPPSGTSAPCPCDRPHLVAAHARA